MIAFRENDWSLALTEDKLSTIKVGVRVRALILMILLEM